jgi:hypothetical protein
MDRLDRSGERVEWLRRWMLWVLVLGLVGTETELILLEHYDDPWQFVPLILVALGFVVLIWHARGGNAATLRMLKIIMGLFLIAGFVGLALHFRGAVKFQLELDPTIGTWEMVKKVMRVKAPPVLAPGVMLQLGLIGLAYAYSDSRERGSKQS